MTIVTHSTNPVIEWINYFISLCRKIPYSFIALLGRFIIALVFWRSGQTKVEGLVVDFINGDFSLGIPHISASAIDLFRTEYKLPVLPPEIAATLAALGEHFLSFALLLGLGTRFAALGLLVMTLTIQFLVYPDAYPTHGQWATILLMLIAFGPGKISIDRLIARHYRLR